MKLSLVYIAFWNDLVRSPSVSYLVAVEKYWGERIQQKPLEAINTVIIQLILVYNSAITNNLTFYSAKGGVLIVMSMRMCS